MLEAASAQDAVAAYYPGWQFAECLKTGDSTYCRIRKVVAGAVAEEKYVMVDEERRGDRTLYSVCEADAFDAT